MANKSQALTRSASRQFRKGIGRRLERIRSLSEARAQSQFVELLGISQPQLSSIETGRSALSLNVINRLTKMKIGRTRINMDWLLTGKGEMLVYELPDNNEIEKALIQGLSQLNFERKEIILKLIRSYI